MKYFTNFSQGFIGIAILAASIGCGGSNDVGTQTSLVGNWVESPLSDRDTRLTINANGVVTGQTLNFSIGGTDILSGTLHGDGAFVGRVTNDKTKTFTYEVLGTIKPDGSANQIRVMYSGSVDGAKITADTVMVRN